VDDGSGQCEEGDDSDAGGVAVDRVDSVEGGRPQFLTAIQSQPSHAVLSGLLPFTLAPYYALLVVCIF
jgi:hypothetical protein